VDGSGPRKTFDGGHPLRQSLANTAEFLKSSRIKGLVTLPGVHGREHAWLAECPTFSSGRGHTGSGDVCQTISSR
jgi:hypothetical protein